MHFFHQQDTNGHTNLEMGQSLIDFMNANTRKNNSLPDEDFTNPQPDNTINQKFNPKSNWTPKTTNTTLDTFQRSFKQDLLKSKPKRNRHNNLTRDERLGLSDLKLNPEVVTKKADKGSAVVSMTTTDYIREGYRQLSDKNFYQILKEDPTANFSTKIAQVLSEMRSLNLITENNFEYLNVKNPTEGRFYLLPKIHKKNIPGRPICSPASHPTSNIC